jgi:pentatricopeptide repeat protein
MVRQANFPFACSLFPPPDIARYCPTIANRTVYRQENKERAKGCYICGEEGHHAEECKELEALAEEFPKFQSKLQSGMKLNVKVWAVMLEKCAKALELNGALYLYEEMLTKGIEPNADVMKHLEYIYDRSGKDHSKLDGIPMRKKRVQRLKEIVQAHRFEAKKEQATDSIVTHLVHFLKSNGSARAAAEHQSSLFDLAKHLKKISESTQIPGLNEPLSSATARLALTTLKSLGRYHQKSKACEFDLDGEDVNQPGKFVKKEAPKEGEKAETKTSKKKKKVKASKKKKEKAAAAAAAAGSTDADGDVDMKSDEKSSSKKDKKRKAEDAASSKQENGAKKSKPSASTKKPAAATATAAPAVKAEKKRKAAPVEEDDAPATEKEEKKSSTTKKAAKKVKA